MSHSASPGSGRPSTPVKKLVVFRIVGVSPIGFRTSLKYRRTVSVPESPVEAPGSTMSPCTYLPLTMKSASGDVGTLVGQELCVESSFGGR